MGRGHPRFFYLLRAYGARKVTAALYSRGMPPTMRALAAYLAEEERREAREIYTGNALWALLKIVGKDIKLPSLAELMHEERTRDNRTGKQIVAEVLAQLQK